MLAEINEELIDLEEDELIDDYEIVAKRTERIGGLQ
jgi:hypothetical protein